MTKPAFSRVMSVKARCGVCGVPMYEDVVLNKNYTIITTSFLALQGGDDHHILYKNGMNKYTEDLSDVDILAWHFQHYSPVYPEVEGRITFVNGTHSSSSRLHGGSILIVLTAVFVQTKAIFI